MSLLDIVNGLNFDPSKDQANDNSNNRENLPGGTYDIVVNSAQFHAYNSGYECIALDVKVVTGDYANRHEFINLNVDKDDPNNQKYSFMLERNIKNVIQFAYAADIQLKPEDWEDQVTLGEALQDASGKQMILIVKPWKSKNGKSGNNYEFQKYPEDEIDDEDLPFL